jgi:hypothetical protein
VMGRSTVTISLRSGRAVIVPTRSIIARSGVTATRLLCDPLPHKNVLKVPHAKNLGENTVLSFSTKCTKRSPRFSRVRYSGSGYWLHRATNGAKPWIREFGSMNTNYGVLHAQKTTPSTLLVPCPTDQHLDKHTASTDQHLDKHTASSPSNGPASRQTYCLFPVQRTSI